MKPWITMCVGMLASPALASEPPEVQTWANCLMAAADRFEASGEQVATIVTAALGACRAEDDAVYGVRVRVPFALRLLTGPANARDREQATQAQDDLRARFREQLTGYILEQRATRGTPATAR
jgi:hypothetical protein